MTSLKPLFGFSLSSSKGFFAASSEIQSQDSFRVEGAAKNPVVLFGRKNSIYRQFDLDVYDVLRDARTYSGDAPVIAHPPCRGWGRLRSFAKVSPGELDLAHFAVAAVRRCGGVLEHPAHSMLWPAAGLPAPGERDSFGGFTFPILQSWFGHVAPKPTWLYFVGLSPGDLPVFPFALGIPSGRVEFMSTAKREKTPVDLAAWLISAVLLVGNSPKVLSGITGSNSPKVSPGILPYGVTRSRSVQNLDFLPCRSVSN